MIPASSAASEIGSKPTESSDSRFSLKASAQSPLVKHVMGCGTCDNSSLASSAASANGMISV
ncbi:MAG: hypothetical protein IPN47_18110 [Gemmatimonadetes bacterium]|nr:hypothetical protein [Gemmatimonadota bacterium]